MGYKGTYDRYLNVQDRDRNALPLHRCGSIAVHGSRPSPYRHTLPAARWGDNPLLQESCSAPSPEPSVVDAPESNQPSMEQTVL
jgi:hypothetical protein